MNLTIQIINNTRAEATFYLTNFEIVRLLPGINLISPNQYELLSKHDMFKIMQDLGELKKQNSDLDDISVDKDTGLGVLENEGEEVGVFNSTQSTNVTPVISGGVTFTAANLKSAGIARDLSTKILEAQPLTGWADAQNIGDTLALTEEQTAGLKKLFGS